MPVSVHINILSTHLKLSGRSHQFCQSTLDSLTGALEAPLMGVSEDMVISLPPITMVFTCVDGGKAYAGRHREEAHQVGVG